MKKLKDFNDKYCGVLFFVPLILLAIVMLTTERKQVIVDNCNKDISSYKIIYKDDYDTFTYDVKKEDNCYYITNNSSSYKIVYTEIYKLVKNEYLLVDSINDNILNNYFIIDYLYDLKSDNITIINDDKISFDDNIIITNDKYIITIEV